MNQDKLQDYLTAYKQGFSFTPAEQITYELNGIRISVDISEYNDQCNHREMAHILLEKDGSCYECDCMDEHDWASGFYPVTLEGKAYILFRKTLYGFTLLDAETLTEAYDYFPEKVFRGDESFIITHAQAFGKYLIFDGCIWSAPYEFYAYDHAQKRFLNLTEVYGIMAGDRNAMVDGDTLILKGQNTDGKSAEVTLTESDIDRLMTERGTTDF